MEDTSSSSSSSRPLWFTHPKDRLLGEDGNNNDNSQSSYLADSDGNAYEPYSTAWRYLGMYIDCDIEDDDSSNSRYSYNDGGVNRRRAQQVRRPPEQRRDLKSGDGSGDGDDCSRKLLWAAYRDPGYKGGSIGEYQFYDWKTDTWDDSTCQTKRCAKMDCHAGRTRWQLVGVFKETDGLVDWAEQLIKHEGYCLWDGDKEEEGGGGSHDGNGDSSTGDYEFMYARQEKWTQSCTKLYLQDSDGNTVYRDIQPKPGGNITDALYYDEDCAQKATMSWAEYIIAWYTYYYYNAEGGQTVAKSWMGGIERWNELMTEYKVCQPCRAYNKVPMDANNGGDHRDRFLGDNQDGEGDEEQWGYNCYDDAGYLNCNQCYKFEAKTSMELATVADLERASSQGTILAIQVNGTIYGKGGFHAAGDNQYVKTAGWVFALTALLGVAVVFGCWFKTSVLQWMAKFKTRQVHAGSLKETFIESPADAQEIFDQLQDDIARKSKLIEKQHRNLERLRLELEYERTMRAMELKMLYGENTGSGEDIDGTSNSPEIAEREGDIQTASPLASTIVDQGLAEPAIPSSRLEGQHPATFAFGQGSFPNQHVEAQRLPSHQPLCMGEVNSVDNIVESHSETTGQISHEPITINQVTSVDNVESHGESESLSTPQPISLDQAKSSDIMESQVEAQSTTNYQPISFDQTNSVDRSEALGPPNPEMFPTETVSHCNRSGGGEGELLPTDEASMQSENLQVLPLATVSQHDLREDRHNGAEEAEPSFSLGII